jgi:hypothetical protein
MKQIQDFFHSTSGSMARELVYTLPVVAMLVAGTQSMAARSIEKDTGTVLSVFAALSPVAPAD